MLQSDACGPCRDGSTYQHLVRDVFSFTEGTSVIFCRARVERGECPADSSPPPPVRHSSLRPLNRGILATPSVVYGDLLGQFLPILGLVRSAEVREASVSLLQIASNLFSLFLGERLFVIRLARHGRRVGWRWGFHDSSRQSFIPRWAPTEAWCQGVV